MTHVFMLTIVPSRSKECHAVRLSVRPGVLGAPVAQVPVLIWGPIAHKTPVFSLSHNPGAFDLTGLDNMIS